MERAHDRASAEVSSDIGAAKKSGLAAYSALTPRNGDH
jgi:hypothetical protein